MSAEALNVLRSIDRKLDTLIGLVTQAARQAKGATSSVGTVASDKDLDGQYGNPVVRFDPRDWVGPSFKGCHMSECPPDYLDLYANAKDYFGQKAEDEGKTTAKGKPVASYERADAARARGWAKRIREGKHLQTSDVDHDGAGWADESEEIHV